MVSYVLVCYCNLILYIISTNLKVIFFADEWCVLSAYLMLITSYGSQAAPPTRPHNVSPPDIDHFASTTRLLEGTRSSLSVVFQMPSKWSIQPTISNNSQAIWEHNKTGESGDCMMILWIVCREHRSPISRTKGTSIRFWTTCQRHGRGLPAEQSFPAQTSTLRKSTYKKNCIFDRNWKWNKHLIIGAKMETSNSICLPPKKHRKTASENQPFQAPVCNPVERWHGGRSVGIAWRWRVGGLNFKQIIAGRRTPGISSYLGDWFVPSWKKGRYSMI